MAQIEHLDLRLHPRHADQAAHGLQMCRYIDLGVLAEIHHGHIRAADIRLKLHDMR